MTAPIPPDDREIDRIFTLALTLPAAEHAAFLDGECEGQPELRQEVEALLAEVREDRDPLFDADQDQREGWLRQAEASLVSQTPAERVGPYSLLQEIGRGGMGVVYLAERADGAFEQKVALKLVLHGASVGRQRRFRRERQILASLDHSGIARLLDGGITEQGLLYLVMEHVEGQAIDAYCDAHDLGLRARITLFLEVCTAVSAAHRQLVVHRDLKPSNILVSGEGAVKLLDFGIAKLLDPDAGDRSAEEETREPTQDHSRVMTPSYASPEQFLGARITVASDVYQLGLLLYRLLTGRLPYRLPARSVAETARLICEAVPPKSSAAHLENSRDSTHVTVESGDAVDPARVAAWTRALRGDLDTIVAKALAKAPARRYASVEALANDLGRHLGGQPIAARRPTLGYVAGKFLVRNRWAVLAVLAIIGLVAGYSLQLYQARGRADRARISAEQARDEAETLAGSLVSRFELADPERSADDPVDALALLERSVDRVQNDLDAHPLTRARFLHTIGEIYTKLARFDAAAELVRSALALRESELAADNPAVVESVNLLGVVLGRLQRFDEAEALLVRALAAREEVGEPELLAVTLNNLGNLRWRQGQLVDAEEFHRRALATRRDAPIPDPRRIGDSANNLGVLLNAQARFEEAVPFLEEAAEAHESAFGPGHPTPAVARNNLGIAARALGRIDESLANFRHAANTWSKAYGPDHPRTLRARSNIAMTTGRQGDPGAAIEILREVLVAQEAAPLPDAVEIGRTLSLLGVSLTESGDWAAADEHLRRAIALRTEVLGAHHLSTLISRTHLARVHRLQGHLKEAEQALRSLLQTNADVIATSRMSKARVEHELALVLIARGAHAEAEPFLQRAVDARRRLLTPDHPEALESEQALAALIATLRGQDP